MWLTSGNFRPIGRFFEHLGYAVPAYVSKFFGLTPFEVYSQIRLILFIMLTFCIFQLFKRVEFGNSRSNSDVALFVSLFTLSVIYINTQEGSLRLFPTFYTTALIFYLISITLYVDEFRKPSNRSLSFVIKVGIGVLAACYNEITYLILPFVVLMLLVCNSRKSPMSELVKSVFSFISPTMITFFLIWVPVRWKIFLNCNESLRYAPSNLSFSNQIPGTWIDRVLSALPPIPQLKYHSRLTSIPSGRWNFSSVVLFSIFLFVVIFTLSRTIRISSREDVLWGLLGLSVLQISVVALAFSLSSQLQENDYSGRSWRETGLYLVWIALLLSAVIFLLVRRFYASSKTIVSIISSALVALLFYCNTSTNSKITEWHQKDVVYTQLVTAEKYLVIETRSNLDVIQNCSFFFEEKNYAPEVFQALVSGFNDMSLALNKGRFCEVD